MARRNDKKNLLKVKEVLGVEVRMNLIFGVYLLRDKICAAVTVPICQSPFPPVSIRSKKTRILII